MGPEHKYSPLNHGGLEVAQNHEAPEVVQQPSLLSPHNRKSSLHQPEPYHAVPYYNDKRETGNFYADPHRETGNFYADPHSAAPTYQSTISQGYFDPERDKKDVVVSAQEVQNGRHGRRYCGMRKTIFIAVIAIIILLIVVGAVLGGVLGVLLPQ